MEMELSDIGGYVFFAAVAALSVLAFREYYRAHFVPVEITLPTLDVWLEMRRSTGGSRRYSHAEMIEAYEELYNLYQAAARLTPGGYYIEYHLAYKILRAQFSTRVGACMVELADAHLDPRIAEAVRRGVAEHRRHKTEVAYVA